MDDERVGESILDGPRGRRLCWSLLTSTDPLLATLAYQAAHAPPGSGPVMEVADHLAGVSASSSARWDEPAVLDALAASTSAAMYWQEPDDADALLTDPLLGRALQPVARRIVDSEAAAWWSSPVALDCQRYVQWTGDWPTEPPTLTGTSALVANWKARTLRGEREAAIRSQASSIRWSSDWWSTPALSGLTMTTRPLPGFGAAKLLLIEDSMGWTSARVWPLIPKEGCRVYEVTGPPAWRDLVARYPMDVSESRRHDWCRSTGHDGPWVIPDWAAVASDFDAVHLSVTGYLSTAGRALPVAGSRTLLAGWSPDETYWLSDVLELAGDPEEWHRMGATGQPFGRVP